MTGRIIANLIRQKLTLELLEKLQAEEISHLMELNPTAVSSVELSIQELLRQLMTEREELRAMIRSVDSGANRLAHILDSMDDVSRKSVNILLHDIDRLEQSRAIQAEKNSRMAKALFEQSKSYVNFIQEKITPKPPTYTRRGEHGAYSAHSRSLGHTLGRT
ncbi:MAG: flagellar export chaperone FlgN [Desulfovibrionaceae bacterium]|nr:flagellar export chaperone FlgN [Desulfovibrionaceae bacterium]MBF0512958.1 flagellar export chaperone FlgN [Desulfovibrionaceae bacterium]